MHENRYRVLKPLWVLTSCQVKAARHAKRVNTLLFLLPPKNLVCFNLTDKIALLNLLRSLLLLSLLAPPNVVGLPGCEGGDEGGRGYAWDQVSLRRGFSVSGLPIESRNVLAFQNIRVFVEIYTKNSCFVERLSNGSSFSSFTLSVSICAIRLGIRQHSSAYVSIRQHTSVYRVPRPCASVLRRICTFVLVKQVN